MILFVNLYQLGIQGYINWKNSYQGIESAPFPSVLKEQYYILLLTKRTVVYQHTILACTILAFTI